MKTALISFLVLAWASTAGADCGFVLWRVWNIPDPMIEHIDSFDSRAQCVAALTNWSRTTGRAAPKVVSYSRARTSSIGLARRTCSSMASAFQATACFVLAAARPPWSTVAF
jgi:hypothetical protein